MGPNRPRGPSADWWVRNMVICQRLGCLRWSASLFAIRYYGQPRLHLALPSEDCSPIFLPLQLSPPLKLITLLRRIVDTGVVMTFAYNLILLTVKFMSLNDIILVLLVCLISFHFRFLNYQIICWKSDLNDINI
jgi:hypothetical protein